MTGATIRSRRPSTAARPAAVLAWAPWIVRFVAFALVLATVVGRPAGATSPPAASEDGAAQVLTPDVGPRLEAAFLAAAPAFRLDDAKIWPHHIDARVCRADQSCVSLRLTLPDARCAGRRSRAWCVTFAAAEPADADALLAVLPGGAALADDAPLVDRVAGSVEHAAVWGVSTATWLWIYALLPLAAGLLIGGLLRWRLRRRLALHGGVVAALLVAVPCLGAEVALRTGLVGALDGATLLGLAAIVALVVVEARFARPGPWLLALASLLLSLLGAEALVRLGPRPPVIEAERLSLLLNDARPGGAPLAKAEALVHCALYAAIGSETARCLRLQEPPVDGPWVLHLGDSMVYGSGVDAARAFPALLPALTPGLAHRNGGIPGVSIDLQLGLLQRVLAVARPTEVLLHIMPGNDLEEVDLPSDFCDGAPAMVRDAAGVRPRCPTPRWRAWPWWGRVLASRLPLPLAALGSSSWLVRDLAVLQRRVLESKRSYRPDIGADTAGYAAYLDALRTTLRAAGVPLQITLMPLRRSAYETSVEPRRARIRAILDAAGLDAWDSQPLVDDWVQEAGEAAVFRDDPPGDIHLNEEGQRRLAAALAELARRRPRRP